MTQLHKLFKFIDAGVSPFHACAEACTLLEQSGFVPLNETDPWALVPGGCYYITRNGSAVVAFRAPQRLTGWHMVLSHSDSPTWRVKSLGKKGPGDVIRLETEGYGGMIVSSWLDRPLTLAGRVLVERAGTLQPRLVYLDRDLLIIPSLCIHFDREVNAGRKLNLQTELAPLYGPAEARPLIDLLAEAAGCAPEEIADTDLTLCPRQNAVALGPEGEYFAAPRIDDLECAYTTLAGFLAAAPDPDCGQLWAMLDNEEVGSGTRQGAMSTFLRDVTDRAALSLCPDAQSRYTILANSFALSADNGHALHPNYPDKSDPEHAPVLNGGVLIKCNASQKYTSTGLTAAVFRAVCRRAGVPVQVFANRADIPGGSTLGNLQSHSVSVPMVDIGLAQLAMHSCVETAGSADAAAMQTAVQAFFETPLRCTGDGRYTLK